MARLDGSAFADAMADAQRKAGGGVRQRRHRTTDREAALSAAAQAEYLAQQLRAIADAADLPPPEAFADTLDPDELPEPPFDVATDAPWMLDDAALAVSVAVSAVPTTTQAVQATGIAPEGNTTALLARSSRATRVDFACRPTQSANPTSAELRAALASLQRLSRRVGHWTRR